MPEAPDKALKDGFGTLYGRGLSYIGGYSVIRITAGAATAAAWSGSRYSEKGALCLAHLCSDSFSSLAFSLALQLHEDERSLTRRR